MKIYRFRNCYLNLTERLVIKDGQFVELTPKALDVLHLLLESGGRVVTKDEILGQVWNGSFVEEGNLPVYISKLRRSLGESKSQPFIETVQGSGYRFVAPVETVGQDEWEKNSPNPGLFNAQKTSDDSTFDSIAVLPLHNECRDPEMEYLADGLTEGFINSLSHLADLKVIARNTVFRYKDKTVDPKDVGETLGVSTVLTGRIRVIKDNLIIGIELTNVKDGSHLWGDRLDVPFSDLIDVQQKIIFAISEKLKSQITGKNTISNPITQNPESYRLYLKGKYFLEKRTEEDIHKAIDFFQKSVSLEPTNVHSYVEVVESYGYLYSSDFIPYEEFLIKIKPLLSALTSLNSSVASVQALYGRKMYYEWKFKESEKHLQMALQLNSNFLIAYYRYTDLLMATGKFPDALKMLNQIMRIDPLSFRSYLIIGRAFYKMGQYENALIYLKDTIELEPNSFEALAVMGATLAELGNYSDAKNVFHKSLDIHFNVEVFSMLGYIHALEGKRNDAYDVINEIKSQSKINLEFLTIQSRIYAALGESDLAYEYLERAFGKREVDLISLISDPRWKTIRDEKRFINFINRIGLLDK